MEDKERNSDQNDHTVESQPVDSSTLGPSSPVPEEKAVIDLVKLSEQAKAYWEIISRFVLSKYYQCYPVVKTYAVACWEIIYQQVNKQYQLLNLRTRTYKYRTLVALTVLFLIFFSILNSFILSPRINDPRPSSAKSPLKVIQVVPEIAEKRLTQEEDALRHKNLVERTPGLGTHGHKEEVNEFKADPNNPQSVAKLLSRMVGKDLNLLHYFRSVLDKHDPGGKVTEKQARVGRVGIPTDDVEIDDDEDEEEEELEEEPVLKGGKRIVPGQTLTSQQLLLKAWTNKQGQLQRKEQQQEQQQEPTQEEPETSETADVKVVDYENPYLLGDLGAAQINLPHVKNISVYIGELAAFTDMLNKQKVAGDDAQLVQLVKDYWIRPPSSLPYHLQQPDLTDFSMGQAPVVDEILRQKRNGFFVECGALDGETRSNTLFFERERNWTGLLIEPGPVNYRRMVKKHRKSFISPACLGVDPFPARKFFHRGKNRGRLLDAEDSFQWVADQYMILDRTGVQCFPLYTFLLALNQTHVDYFSLDVEGVEMEVLQSIPFHLLDIDVISVEYAHGRATKEELRDYVTNVLGYRVVYEVARKDWLANDFILVREDLLN